MYPNTLKFFSILFLLSTLLFTLTAAPKIEVDKADVDIGILKMGEKKSIKHTFIVKNTGTDTLIIEKAKPG